MVASERDLSVCCKAVPVYTKILFRPLCSNSSIRQNKFLLYRSLYALYSKPDNWPWGTDAAVVDVEENFGVVLTLLLALVPCAGPVAQDDDPGRLEESLRREEDHRDAQRQDEQQYGEDYGCGEACF